MVGRSLGDVRASSCEATYSGRCIKPAALFQTLCIGIAYVANHEMDIGGLVVLDRVHLGFAVDSLDTNFFSRIKPSPAFFDSLPAIAKFVGRLGRMGKGG